MHIQIDNPLLLASCCAAARHFVFAQDPAGAVRWQSSGLGSGAAGGGFAACCSGLFITVGRFTVVRKGVHRHSGKRPPPTRTVCFAACAWWRVLLSVVYCLVCFREKTVDVLVGSQARLEHYLLLFHQGPTDACKTTQTQMT